MKKLNRLNQKGFSFIEALIIVAVALLLATIGWYVWRHSHSNVAVEEAPNNLNESTAVRPKIEESGTNKGYLVIKELNLRVKPVDDLKNVTYTHKVNDTKDVITFHTVPVDSGSCNKVTVTDSLANFPIVTITSEEKQVLNNAGESTGVFVKTINGRNYQLRYPQMACGASANDADNSFNDTLDRSYKAALAMFKSLEPAQ